MNKATELKRFLIENNCKKEFVENVRLIEPDGTVEYLRVLVGQGKWVFSQAFTWMDTPQGHEYWCDIHEKWVSR